MEITQSDFNETLRISQYVKTIDSIDAEYALLISDEIFDKQPFFLSVLLGYHLDVLPEELEEIMKLYFIMWEYFKSNSRIPANKITEDDFVRIEKKNIQMLEYAQGEPTEEQRILLYSDDLQNTRSKALWPAIFLRFQIRPVLINMKWQTTASVIVGIKSFIECFETIK